MADLTPPRPPLAFSDSDPDSPSDGSASSGTESQLGGFRAHLPETWPKPEELTWGDYMMRPHRPLSARHKEIARLVFLGKKNEEICEKMGCTSQTISKLKGFRAFAQEVERLQNAAFQQTVQDRLKEMGPLSADVIEEILRSEDSNIKPALKADLAKWVAEKLTGKPKQEVDVQSSTLSDFMDLVKQAQQTRLESGEREARQRSAQGGEQSEEIIELSQGKSGNYEKWIEENLLDPSPDTTRLPLGEKVGQT